MRRLLGIILLCGLVVSCQERVDLNAPPQEILVVYGVLDPSQITQDIRISKVYQTEEDAFEFASTFDPSLSGLQVTLEGPNQIWKAVEIDSVRRDPPDGTFGEYTSVYRFATPIDSFLEYGETYRLVIRTNDGTVEKATAYTRIPPKPFMLQPTIFRNGGEQCRTIIAPEDSILVSFFPQYGKFATNAYTFDIQVMVRFEENGKSREAIYHVPSFFSKSRGCGGSGATRICYQIGNGDILSAWLKYLDDSSKYQYTPGLNCLSPSESFSRNAIVQVVSVDTFLGKYTLANRPIFNELNTVRRTFTNIEAEPKALGVFGSVARTEMPVDISDCAEYLMGFRNEKPFGCTFP